MKLFLLGLFLIMLPFKSVFGQREVVEARLEEYNIPGDYIVNGMRDASTQYYFKFKSVTWLPSKQGMEEVIEVGEFDPAQPVGQRWRLLKVNNREPLKKEIKKFDRTYNTTRDNVDARIDEEHYRILEDNDEYLVLNLKYQKESLPNRYKFLNRCTGMAFVDKQQKRLTKIEYKNEYPVKVWIYKAAGLSLVQHFTYNEEEDTYFITQEELDIQTDYVGQGVTILLDIEYSDFKKVK